MRVINVGLARTGTTSLKAALELLGISPVHHTFDLFTSPKDMSLWEGAFEGKPVNWREFYADYEAADWPAAFFYKEIIDVHPEAKLLLTIRDPEKWVESVSNTVQQGMNIKLPIPHLRRIKHFIITYAADKLFDGRLDDKAHMIRCYHRHVENVKAYVPENRLLLYDVRDGWESLCQFLAVNAPHQPYPRVNTRGGFKGMVMQMVSGMKGSG
ncbi:sulfotransferase family protein [Candidatus Leptofilum sp.]|uniref:sulfotransferase family protein n=1 Tax=Candidatus Leptofilum sp. TaxID=3241576 RepID=UPI003B5ACA78